MSTATGKKLLTSAEYMSLYEQGVFTEDDRVELIEGEVVPKIMVGPLHVGRVGRVHRFLHRRLGDRALVVSQGTVLLSEISMPEPDFVILRWRDDFYESRHATPADMLALIEVADSSLSFDRGRKLRIYAAARVQEYWVLNLVDHVLEVFRQPGPHPSGYASVATYRRGDRIAFLAFPDLDIAVEELLP
jgi:Uma2 family endonuclease